MESVWQATAARRRRRRRNHHLYPGPPQIPAGKPAQPAFDSVSHLPRSDPGHDGCDPMLRFHSLSLFQTGFLSPVTVLHIMVQEDPHELMYLNRMDRLRYSANTAGGRALRYHKAAAMFQVI